MITHKQAVSHLRVMWAALFAAIFLVGVHTTADAITIFNATLTGSQETPPNSSTATGTATFILNDAQTALSFTATIFGLDFTGSQTPASTADNLVAAHIHCCAAPGAAASIVWGFFGSPFNDNNPNDNVFTPFGVGVGGTVSGKWDAPEGNSTTLAEQLPSILAGLSYINFHTTQFPGGEIRGQILKVPEPSAFILFGIGLLVLRMAASRRQKRLL
ncbi:MAG TPA: CHRD domain-containing protein [Candidatus Binatia bacterium]|jgi:hypothetical protein|nr:CHRD domain-containing protein [Candidatus Binatia bacterium]